MTTTHSPRLRTLLVASSMIVAGGMLLAGCASTSEEPEETTSTEQPSGDEQTAESPAGVSGLIAYAEDGVLQVQSSDEQTTVRYTEETTVTKTVTVDASTIAVGDCVVVVTDEEGTSATSVTVSDAAEDGTCSGGLGGGGGFPGGGDGEMPSGDGERPEGAPTDMPSGAPDGGEGQGGGFGQFVSGPVTAVADGSITVESTGFGEDAETTSTEVALTEETTVTGTVDGSTSDIATGLCVTAMGEADDAGGYDATSLALSDADENGECSAGLGGMPGGGSFPGGGEEDE